MEKYTFNQSTNHGLLLVSISERIYLNVKQTIGIDFFFVAFQNSIGPETLKFQIAVGFSP